jgi:hypothetical protein
MEEHNFTTITRMLKNLKRILRRQGFDPWRIDSEVNKYTEPHELFELFITLLDDNNQFTFNLTSKVASKMIKLNLIDINDRENILYDLTNHGNVTLRNLDFLMDHGLIIENLSHEYDDFLLGYLDDNVIMSLDELGYKFTQ